MGIASRTKWDRRARMPVHVIQRFDMGKMLSRASNAEAIHQAEPMFAERRKRRAAAAAKAAAKRAGHRARRRKAAQKRGWRPYAKR